jgi:hypothetical protein
MNTYFVEGTIKVKIDVEIEATSLEDAEKKAFEKFKDEHILYNYAEIVEDSTDLMAGVYDDEEYDNEDE